MSISHDEFCSLVNVASGIVGAYGYKLFDTHIPTVGRNAKSSSLSEVIRFGPYKLLRSGRFAWFVPNDIGKKQGVIRMNATSASNRPGDLSGGITVTMQWCVPDESVPAKDYQLALSKRENVPPQSVRGIKSSLARSSVFISVSDLTSAVRIRDRIRSLCRMSMGKNKRIRVENKKQRTISHTRFHKGVCDALPDDMLAKDVLESEVNPDEFSRRNVLRHPIQQDSQPAADAIPLVDYIMSIFK